MLHLILSAALTNTLIFIAGFFALKYIHDFNIYNYQTNMMISDSFLFISVFTTFILMETWRKKKDKWCEVVNSSLYTSAGFIGYIIYMLIFHVAFRHAYMPFKFENFYIDVFIKLLFILVPCISWYVLRKRVYVQPCNDCTNSLTK